MLECFNAGFRSGEICMPVWIILCNLIYFPLKFLCSSVTLPSKKQNICITFVQRRPSVFDVGQTLYKCYTNVLCLLGMSFWYVGRNITCNIAVFAIFNFYFICRGKMVHSWLCTLVIITGRPSHVGIQWWHVYGRTEPNNCGWNHLRNRMRSRWRRSSGWEWWVIPGRSWLMNSLITTVKDDDGERQSSTVVKSYRRWRKTRTHSWIIASKKSTLIRTTNRRTMNQQLYRT